MNAANMFVILRLTIPEVCTIFDPMYYPSNPPTKDYSLFLDSLSLETCRAK